VRSAAKGRFGVSNILYGIYHLAGLLYMIAVHSPELVHMPVTSNLPGFFRDSLFIRVCKLAGIPVTGHLHGGAFDKFLRTSKPWRRKFILNSISKLDTLIVLSNYWKNLLEPELKGTRITVVNNAVSPEWLMTGDEREKSGERINILFVGSLGKRKGVFEILRAAALLAGSRRDLHFDLVGTEERLGEKDKLMKLFRELKLDSDMVTFRGALYGEDKMSAYRKADIFILPAFNEAFPIVILEAFGSGLPVITCPVGSIPEVIKNGENGFMVKPGDWRALAEKIELLADEPELRQWMGENNRRALKENYVAERMVEKIDDVYRSILGLEPRIQRKTGSGVGTTRPKVFQSRKQKSREPVAAGAGNIAD
jgi:glycosyltransferase involved in cell wall biosynthesis